MKSPGRGVRSLGSSSGSRHVTGVTQGPSVGLLFPIYKMGVGSDALADERSRSQWVPRKLWFTDEEPACPIHCQPLGPESMRLIGLSLQGGSKDVGHALASSRGQGGEMMERGAERSSQGQMLDAQLPGPLRYLGGALAALTPSPPPRQPHKHSQTVGRGQPRHFPGDLWVAWQGMGMSCRQHWDPPLSRDLPPLDHTRELLGQLPAFAWWWNLRGAQLQGPSIVPEWPQRPPQSELGSNANYHHNGQRGEGMCHRSHSF